MVHCSEKESIHAGAVEAGRPRSSNPRATRNRRRKGFGSPIDTRVRPMPWSRIPHCRTCTARLPCSSCGVTHHCVVSYGKYRASTEARGQTHTTPHSRVRVASVGARVHQGIARFVTSVIDRPSNAIGHPCRAPVEIDPNVQGFVAAYRHGSRGSRAARCHAVVASLFDENRIGVTCVRRGLTSRVISARVSGNSLGSIA